MTTPRLFGLEEVDYDRDFTELARNRLDATAWVDYSPMFLSGDQTLFAHLVDHAEWTQPIVQMYERKVRTPRLVARIERHIHPVIPEIIEALSDRYGIRLDQVSAGWYRDGNDSVAYHGDRIAREMGESIVATISLGGPRRFLMRPTEGGQGRSFSLGLGDLVVMGGSCQRTWEHSIPKASSAPPRIALMFRHVYI